MNIAIVQLEPIKGDIEKNIENHLKWIKRAAENQTDLVVFPELSLTGYEPELALEKATDQNDERLDCFQRLSDENGISIGVGIPTRNQDHLFVSMIIFQPEMERITYSKQHLYSTEIPVFTPGNNPLVLKFGNETVAPAICYELSNKKHHDFAVENNATVYLASVFNSVEGVDSDIKKLSKIARNHKMITFMANFNGVSCGYKAAGKSSVWDDNGALIAQLGADEEGMLIYDTVNRKEKVVLSDR